MNPIGPRSVYDEAKRFAEAATMAYHRYHEVDTRIVRIFNTYGPRLQIDDGRVISNFMKQALRGEDLTVYGDGLQTRSFCYVSDEIAGIVALVEVRRTPAGEHRQSRRVHHAGVREGRAGSHGVSRARYASSRCRRTIPGSAVPTSPKPARCWDWEPKIDLRTGLQLSLDYFRAAVHGGSTVALK